MKRYDTIIIGGGFFGLSLARYLKENLGQNAILVLEKENDFLQRASYNNQARVHNGYHYPRSMLTALRSRVNFPTFVQDFKPAIVSDFDKYYAVADNFSKVSSEQFRLFSERIGSDIEPAPRHIKELFNDRLIQDVFKVKEYAFNSKKLKEMLLAKLETLGVELQASKRVERVEPIETGGVRVILAGEETYEADKVLNCTYSLINDLNINSGLPIISLKHELTEMALIKMPVQLDGLGVTVMCGPFFSFMPFPSKGLYTLSHVRYTPHSEWYDKDVQKYRDGHDYLESIEKVSHYPQMIADAQRYMPGLKNVTYEDSLWEIKTVLPQSEGDDGRPILFGPDHGIEGYTCIMGGKLDNIYDAYKELDILYGKA